MLIEEQSIQSLDLTQFEEEEEEVKEEGGRREEKKEVELDLKQDLKLDEFLDLMEIF